MLRSKTQNTGSQSLIERWRIPKRRQPTATNRSRIRKGEISPLLLQVQARENRRHYIARCIKFKRMSLEDKRNAVKKHNLCFRCLKQGHVSANCDKLCPTIIYTRTQRANRTTRSMLHRQTLYHCLHSSRTVVPLWEFFACVFKQTATKCGVPHW